MSALDKVTIVDIRESLEVARESLDELRAAYDRAADGDADTISASDYRDGSLAAARLARELENIERAIAPAPRSAAKRCVVDLAAVCSRGIKAHEKPGPGPTGGAS